MNRSKNEGIQNVLSEMSLSCPMAVSVTCCGVTRKSVQRRRPYFVICVEISFVITFLKGKNSHMEYVEPDSPRKIKFLLITNATCQPICEINSG